MDRLLLSSSSNKTLGLLIEIQSLIEEIALKFQQESLWQVQTPILTTCKIVSLVNFPDQRPVKLFEYIALRQGHLRAFNSTQE